MTAMPDALSHPAAIGLTLLVAIDLTHLVATDHSLPVAIDLMHPAVNKVAGQREQRQLVLSR